MAGKDREEVQSLKLRFQVSGSKFHVLDTSPHYRFLVNK
jgi:hypothetical protein